MPGLTKSQYTFSAINGFYIGTLAFVLLPALFFYNAAAGLIWIYAYIPKMQVSISEIESAVDIISLGLLLVTTTATLPRSYIIGAGILKQTRKTVQLYKSSRKIDIVVIYAISTIALIYKTVVVGGNQYGDTPLDIVYAFANSISSISALILISKKKELIYKLLFSFLFALNNLDI